MRSSRPVILDRRLPMLGTLLVLASTLALLAGGWRPVVRADTTQDAPDPQLILALHSGTVEVVTSDRTRPDVTVTDRRGVEKISLQSAGDRAGDRWAIPLRHPNDPPNEPPVLLRSGDRITVTQGAQRVALTLPALTATAQVESDVVRGSAPPGTAALAVILGWQESLYGPGPDLDPIIAQVASDGTYAVDVSEDFDLAPGTFGSVAMYDPDGHIVLVPFAPPLIVLDRQRAVAQAWADPGHGATLLLQGPSGAEIARSGAGIEYGGGIYALPLARAGDFGDPFIPRAGETIVLEMDGSAVLSEEVPWVTGTVRRVDGVVHGLAPAGSQVVVRPPGPGDAPRRREAIANQDDTYAVTFDATPLPDTATVQAWPRGSVVHLIRATAPDVEVQMWGDRLAGSVAGWGRLEVTRVSGSEAPNATTTVDADPGGRFEAQLAYRGQPVAIAGGDVLRFDPERGEPLELTVPEFSARVDPDRRILSGRGPSGAALEATVFEDDPALFGQVPDDRDGRTVRGSVGADGRYRLDCGAERPPCRLGYGLLRTVVSPAHYVLQWVAEPQSVIAVNQSNTLGYATAGTPITVTVQVRGTEASTWQLRSRPRGAGVLPGWEQPVLDAAPDGLPVGAEVRIASGTVERSGRIPAMSWRSDTAADAVEGTGPPSRPMAAVVAAPPNSGRGNAARNTLIGPAGRWRVAFGGFDFRPGDDLRLYVLGDGGNILHWFESAVLGNDPTPTPRPTATPQPESPRIFLPTLMR